jgi:hypothetical protein
VYIQKLEPSDVIPFGVPSGASNESSVVPDRSTLKTVAELSVSHKFVPSQVMPSACDPGAGKLWVMEI